MSQNNTTFVGVDGKTYVQKIINENGILKKVNVLIDEQGKPVKTPNNMQILNG
jgi:hypothetical protein